MSDSSTKINVMISQEELEEKIAQLGAKISREYEGREIILVCILKGSVFFTCSLAKHIEGDVRLEFMRCSSYGDEDTSSGRVNLLLDMDVDIKGKHVIVAEDIIDTGNTLSYLMKELSSREPASLKLVCLLDKPGRRTVNIKADYSCFTIPDKFVVGYGLDYAQKYRNLPYIGVIE